MWEKALWLISWMAMILTIEATLRAAKLSSKFLAFIVVLWPVSVEHSGSSAPCSHLTACTSDQQGPNLPATLSGQQICILPSQGSLPDQVHPLHEMSLEISLVHFKMQCFQKRS